MASLKPTRSSICHTEQERLLVQPLKVLILKLLPVDALAPGAIALCEVSTLDHEALDDAVEAGALVVQRLASLTHTLLAGA